MSRLTSVWLCALLLASCRLAYVQAGLLGLSPDEAQYWSWLSDLQFSFVTKPPMTTWLMGIGTFLFGDTYLGVRFFAVFGHMLASILAYLIARDVHSERAGLGSFAAFQVTPLLAIGGVLMVSDVPALVCWLAALYVLLKIDWQKPEWRKWLSVGALIGLAGLAKYTAAFFYPLLAVYLLWQRRIFFFKAQPYVAGMISLVIQAPVLWWNYNNDWVGIKHVLGQAGVATSGSYDVWGELGEFMAGQAGTLGIVSFLAMFVFWLRPWGCSDKQKVLWAFSAPLFAFFLWKVTDAKVQANWPILATSVSLIAICTCLGVHRKIVVRFIFGAGLTLNAVLSLLLHDTFILRDMGVALPMKSDPSKDLRGWSEMAESVEGALRDIPETDRPYVITTRYRVMASLLFEFKRQGIDVDVIYVNGGHRMSQYDLWNWPALEGRTALVVRRSSGLPKDVRDGFRACSKEAWGGVSQRDLKIRDVYMTVCTGYKGMEKRLPTTH